jgi:pyridoxal phosphate enzyme (YggS family)
MIVDNYKIVQEKVAERCIKIGRNPDEVQIIAVSKTQPFSVIRETFQAGVLNFAENKAQELRDKFAESDLDIKWHFVGHLQSNKVKYVVQPSTLIHSIDSVKIVDEINKKASDINKVQDILLEINTSGEQSKFGLKDEDDIFKLIDYCNSLTNVSFCGYMTMAPFTDNEVIIRQHLAELAAS